MGRASGVQPEERGRVGPFSQSPLLQELYTGAAGQRRRYFIVYAATWFTVVAALVVLLYINGKFDPHFVDVWTPYILAGIPATLLITFVSISLAIVFAIVGALARLAPWAVVNAIASLYVSVVRGTPLIVQLLFFYLALPEIIPATARIPAIWVGIFGLAFNYGAYMTEIFRAGLQAVPLGQREAAYALGLSGPQTFRRIVLPQAFRIVTPAIGNDFVGMIKDSALVSVITVQELLWRAQYAGQLEYRSLASLLIAAAIYWVMTLLFSSVQVRLERQMARADSR